MEERALGTNTDGTKHLWRGAAISSKTVPLGVSWSMYSVAEGGDVIRAWNSVWKQVLP